VYPGVAEALAALGGRKSTATTKGTPATRLILEQFGLIGYFDHVQGTDGFPYKPAPDVILAALAALGARPEDCLMVGDAPSDMEAGRCAGVKTCAVRYGYGKIEELAVISARGANEKVNIGWIGVGTRGNAAIDWLHTASPNDVKITAICDTYQGYIARGKDRVQTIWGNMPAAHNDYHELLADKSIDAVIIMTPEHLHHDMTISRNPWPTPSKRASTSSRPGRSLARSCRSGRRTAVRRCTRRPRNSSTRARLAKSTTRGRFGTGIRCPTIRRGAT
jgi:hypothetical protein